MIGTANPALQARAHLQARCHDCRHTHEIETPVGHLVARLSDWNEKHLGHHIEFISRYRKVPAKLNDKLLQEHNYTPWYLDYLQNADVKLAYAASAAYTITLASLATSSTLLAGQESTAVDNTSNTYLDYGIAGVITVGTGPTANTSIHVLAYGSQNDTPTYPDVFDGADSAETITAQEIKDAALVLLVNLRVATTTSDRAYSWYPRSLETTFGGFLPKHHGLFVTHNTGVNLHATAGNHVINYTGAYRVITG